MLWALQLHGALAGCQDVVRRLALLIVVTVLMLGLFVVALWRREHYDQTEAVYSAKRNQIVPLQRVKGKRPFTPEEMALLRQFIRDPDSLIRVRAITALWDVRDSQQRQEAIQLVRERLKDPAWVVRSYALHALARLGAKEAVPDILPLLNDPHPDVRNWAQIALKRLGYQVRE